MPNDLPQRLRNLADSLDGCEWVHPLGSASTCREAAERIDMLRGAMEAQDRRECQAGDRCGVSWLKHGCDWPDRVAEEVLHLRAEVERLRETFREVVRGKWSVTGIQEVLGDLNAAAEAGGEG